MYENHCILSTKLVVSVQLLVSPEWLYHFSLGSTRGPLRHMAAIDSRTWPERPVRETSICLGGVFLGAASGGPKKQ